jgi:hypothetical protein
LLPPFFPLPPPPLLLAASLAPSSTAMPLPLPPPPAPAGGAGAVAKSGSGRPSDPAQITLLVSGMQYVRGVEDALDACEHGNAGALASLLAGCVSDLNDLIRLTQTSLSRGDRARVMAMITLDAHGRDIIKKLMDEGVTSRAAFQWQSQLKQRLQVGADGAPRATLAVADAHFDYQFEYLGNGPRLVVTPLTDRIYVTATQALNLAMGCAPAGPAGTGKTESVKDLSNALAKLVYVQPLTVAPDMNELTPDFGTDQDMTIDQETGDVVELGEGHPACDVAEKRLRRVPKQRCER